AQFGLTTHEHVSGCAAASTRPCGLLALLALCWCAASRAAISPRRGRRSGRHLLGCGRRPPLALAPLMAAPCLGTHITRREPVGQIAVRCEESLRSMAAPGTAGLQRPVSRCSRTTVR